MKMNTPKGLAQIWSPVTQDRLAETAKTISEQNSVGNADFSLQPKNQNRENCWLPYFPVDNKVPLVLVNSYDKKYRLQVTPNPELLTELRRHKTSSFRLNLKLFQGNKDSQFRFKQIPAKSCELVPPKKSFTQALYEFKWSKDGRKLDCVFVCCPRIWKKKGPKNMNVYVLIAEIKLGKRVLCADGLLVKKIGYGGSLEKNVERCHSGGISMIETMRREEVPDIDVLYTCSCGRYNCLNPDECEFTQYMQREYMQKMYEKKQKEKTVIYDHPLQVQDYTDVFNFSTPVQPYTPTKFLIIQKSPIDTFKGYTEEQTQSNDYISFAVQELQVLPPQPPPPQQNFERVKKRRRFNNDYRCDEVEDGFYENKKRKFEDEDEEVFELEYDYKWKQEMFSDAQDLLDDDDDDDDRWPDWYPDSENFGY